MGIVEYWDLNPREFESAIKGYELRLGDLDLMNYIQAGYYRSKNFPKKPMVYKQKEVGRKKGMEIDDLAKFLNAKKNVNNS